MKTDEEKKSYQNQAMGFSIGIVFAVTFWIITDNLIMAISVGIVAGMGIGAFGHSKRKK